MPINIYINMLLLIQVWNEAMVRDEILFNCKELRNHFKQIFVSTKSIVVYLYLYIYTHTHTPVF